MKFLDNKYTKWYFNIVEKRKIQLFDGYTEAHHIIPTALGGMNDSSNKVSLSAREHFICHVLLTKMTIGRDRHRMLFPAMLMSKWKNKGINSRIFKHLKEKHVKFLRDPEKSAEMRLKMSNSAKGKKLSDETKKKLSIIRTGKKHSALTKLKMSKPKPSWFGEKIAKAKVGVPRSEETRRKISESKTGKRLSKEAIVAITKGLHQRYIDHPVSAETRIKIGNVHRGKILSDETKAKIGASSKGRTAGVKEWILRDPLGNLHTVLWLAKYCKERNLPWKSISNTEGTNIPVAKGVAKGWIALKSVRL